MLVNREQSMINVQQACGLLQLFSCRLVHIYGRQITKEEAGLQLSVRTRVKVIREMMQEKALPLVY